MRSQLLLTSLAAVALLAPKPAAAKKVVFGDTDVYKALVAVQQAACSDLDAVYARMAEPQEGEPGWIADALALEGGKFADEAL
ncbi:MAG: hypothetical protein VX265_02835, partial [Myxococcota bacterium]|nr:hypothetical protein [Myxococcota bacterium]